VVVLPASERVHRGEQPVFERGRGRLSGEGLEEGGGPATWGAAIEVPLKNSWFGAGSGWHRISGKSKWTPSAVVAESV